MLWEELRLCDGAGSNESDQRALPTSEQDWQRCGGLILIGHSMGGVIARAVVAHPQFKVNSTSTIITLNSPHVYVLPHDACVKGHGL